MPVSELKLLTACAFGVQNSFADLFFAVHPNFVNTGHQKSLIRKQSMRNVGPLERLGEATMLPR